MADHPAPEPLPGHPRGERGIDVSDCRHLCKGEEPQKEQQGNTYPHEAGDESFQGLTCFPRLVFFIKTPDEVLVGLPQKVFGISPPGLGQVGQVKEEAA